jgi:hypothetical protein
VGIVFLLAAAAASRAAPEEFEKRHEVDTQ